MWRQLGVMSWIARPSTSSAAYVMLTSAVGRCAQRGTASGPAPQSATSSLAVPWPALAGLAAVLLGKLAGYAPGQILALSAFAALATNSIVIATRRARVRDAVEHLADHRRIEEAKDLEKRVKDLHRWEEE